ARRVVRKQRRPALAPAQPDGVAAFRARVLPKARNQAEPVLRLAAAAGEDGADPVAADSMQLGDRRGVYLLAVPGDPDKRGAGEDALPHLGKIADTAARERGVHPALDPRPEITHAPRPNADRDAVRTGAQIPLRRTGKSAQRSCKKKKRSPWERALPVNSAARSVTESGGCSKGEHCDVARADESCQLTVP